MCEAMELYRYFKPATWSSSSISSLKTKEKEIVEEFVRSDKERHHDCASHNKYTPEARAAIGKYCAENGPARACQHFSMAGRNLSESTARKFRDEYLAKMKEKIKDNPSPVSPCIEALPTRRQGRPLLLGQKLDETVQEVIRDTRKAGGVINTTTVVA